MAHTNEVTRLAAEMAEKALKHVHVPSVGVDGAQHRQQVGDEGVAERVRRGLEAPVPCTFIQQLPGGAPLCRPRAGSVHRWWRERGEVDAGLN